MDSIKNSITDVEKVIKFDGNVTNVAVSRLIAPGENYLSLVLRVDFDVEKNGHSKLVSTVAKRLPLYIKEESFDMNRRIMKNEIKWYLEIVPVLKEFAEENFIQMDFYPKYYGSRYSLDSSKEEIDLDSVLFLENLISKGYKNEDRYVGFDLITSKIILKKLVLFHALPIAMKEKKSELFQIIKEYLNKSRPPSPGENNSSGSSEQKESPSPPSKPEEYLLDALAIIPDVAPYIPRIRPLFGKSLIEVRKLTAEPWNTIIHSDFWVNNIMVNYRKEKEPLVKIVDFQMCYNGSFAKDLVFFLLTSVKNDVIKEHMDDLLRFYYDEFTSVLRNTNFSLECEEYLEEIRTAAAQSEVAHAIFFSTLVFGEKGTGKDIVNEEFDPLEHMLGMLKKMNQLQKEKLALIVSEAMERSWI